MKERLLIKYLLHETNQAESSYIREWLAKHPANAKAFNQIRLIWKASKQLAKRAMPDVHTAWLHHILLRMGKR
ncbi:hypothetical protein [Parapedobacter tibetensis]|uniref:hypothetical protein n=1 Tax=Parapedobacter tibetensis TaxID=2972951 RepID=UPI00214D2DDE|nr:hypothetical protein [Parapedobacter tibetensis]